MEGRILVVIGNGMVGQRLLDEVRARWDGTPWRAVVFGEEALPAYDRVHLSSYAEGTPAADLSLAGETAGDPRVETLLGDAVVEVDRGARIVRTASGRVQPYDALVFATGSSAFVPPVPGRDLPGCFVYRTFDDVDAIRARATGARAAVVVGGGLLGLEAANAVRLFGVPSVVVEMAPHLLPQQLDPLSGAALQAHVEDLGITVRTAAGLATVEGDADGGVRGVSLADGSVLPADLVVFAAGVRPRDGVARACGLEVGPRGGIAVDAGCRTSDPRIWAVGECVSLDGRLFGLVAPGYDMAAVAAAALMGHDASFLPEEPPTRLKLLGVDVAVFGDARATTAGARVLTWHDEVAGVVKRTVLSPDGTEVVGGSFVGDVDGFLELLQQHRSEAPLPERREELLLGALTLAGGSDADGLICSCNNVCRSAVADAVRGGSGELAQVQSATRAGTSCGSCLPLVRGIVEAELERAGVAVDRSLCPHFAHTRQELFDLVRVQRIETFDELLARHGSGRGCDVCRPAVASMLASLWNEHVLDHRHVALQDTNDRFLANIQRDGTYSVVPRLPGGEITPEKLIVLGEIARDFGLYTKITGGQRIDLFGARVDELPAIWERLIAAGFESGHAYGKALRTVKSCVGSTWCRYGVQDSTGLAVALELRYRGLRAPHKIKSAVSGCARECAEAQSKDFGVIATEKGWNLYVCGNGGMTPRHADLLAEDLDTETLIRYVDRFLMFYVRTANRLERTSTWLDRMEGGIAHLRRVVVDDHLGIAEDLEADLAASLANYRCEWLAAVESPEVRARFTQFVNGAVPAPTPARRLEREQPVPAHRHDRRRPSAPGERRAAQAPDGTLVSVGASRRGEDG